MKKAIVLSSGGVDSTTCISVAVKELGADNVCTASIFYGQKHVKELEAARKVAEWFHVKHYEFDLSSILQYSNCALLAGSSEEIKHESYEDQVKESETGRVSTYVPFRNGLMLSVAASLAATESMRMKRWIFISAPMPMMRPGMRMLTARSLSFRPWKMRFPSVPMARCIWYSHLRTKTRPV